MAGESESEVLPAEESNSLPDWLPEGDAWVPVLGYPLTALVVLFAVPLVLLIAFSFFPKPSGGYYSFGFTLEHYVRAFTTPLYLERLAFTVALSAGTAFACLAVGYPVAYTLARMESRRKRQVYITAIVSTMWLTYIIRSYAIGVILSKNGVLNELLLTVGIVSEPVFSSSGLLPVVLGMTYVFVPFAILTLYSSINNIAPELEEASKNLGADRFQTFRRVILPLSKRGVYAAWMLVFILALGAYIVPKILGDPPQWTLPVIIGDQVTLQLNVPFGAALALIMVTVVMVILALAYKFLSLGARDISGGGPSGE
jgi:ABC-type spermidine/putrescine transport system permease subunit I